VKPPSSASPEATTTGSAARVIRSLRAAISGSATAATPTTRGAISAQTSGRDVLRRPVA
jgi:hypothetical protein